MTGIFGKQTTPPPGFDGSGDPNATGQPGVAPIGSGEEGHFNPGAIPNGQPPNTNPGVPAFEGAESGGITESQPTNPNAQPPADPNNAQPPAQPPGQPPTDPNAQPPADPNNAQPPAATQFDALALETKQAQLDAREAVVIAREAQIAVNGGNTAPGEATPAEEPSLLSDIDPENLESDGEKALFQVAQGLEKELRDTKKAASVADETARSMQAETRIQAAMETYGVTREELDTKFQQTGVGNVEVLAQSVAFDKSQKEKAEAPTNAGQQLQNVAQQERTQSVSRIGGSQGAPNPTQPGTQSRGRGVTNPYDGAQVARVYRAFE